MIKSFSHPGIEKLFRTGSHAGVQPSHAARLKRQLAQLDKAEHARDMGIPGWKLHELQGSRAGEWAVSVSGNWRLVFKFEGKDAIDVGYEDYH